MNNKGFEQFKRVFRFFETGITLGCLCSLFGFAWMYYLNNLDEKPFTGKGNLMEIAVYVLVVFLFIKIFGGFETGFFTPLNVIMSQALGVFCANCVMIVESVLVIGSMFQIGKILLAFLALNVAQIIVSIIVVQLFDWLHFKFFPAWDLLVVYENDNVRMFLDKVNTRKDKYVVSEVLKVDAGYDKICERIKAHDSIIIYDVSSELRNDLLKYCYGEGVRVYQTPKISDLLIRSAREHHLFDTPLLMSRNAGLTFDQKLVKRVLDIIMSVIMFIIASPFMLITAIAIKLEDHGPVFFTQKRVTLDNREFTIYKFRSMIVDAEAKGPQAAVNDDDRITKVGRFIRKTRIDELPQLLNVIKGDMSLVGPRPERVEHVEKYTKEIPEFRFRTRVRGGLTGYAQVYGKYNTSAYDKLKLDLMYIENYSLALDFRIIIMTIKVMFMKSSTEGFGDSNE